MKEQPPCKNTIDEGFVPVQRVGTSRRHRGPSKPGQSIRVSCLFFLLQELHSCGATRSHLPPLILAMKGLAGNPLLPMIGQLAMQGLLVNAACDAPCLRSGSQAPYLTFSRRGDQAALFLKNFVLSTTAIE